MTPGQALKEEEAWGCRGAVRACPFQCRWKWHDGVLPLFLVSKGCLFWASAQRFFPHPCSKSEWNLAKHTQSLPSEGQGAKRHGWPTGSMDKVLGRLSEVISRRITLENPGDPADSLSSPRHVSDAVAEYPASRLPA